jgi:hypothetical protein
MKRPEKPGVSHLSRDGLDKLYATLNHGTNVGSAAYIQNPDYFAACVRWHAELTPQLQRTTSCQRGGASSRPPHSTCEGPRACRQSLHYSDY